MISRSARGDTASIILRGCVGHSVGLVLVATREWFIRFFHTTKSLGVPGSSRGTLERNRVDLTV